MSEILNISRMDSSGSRPVSSTILKIELDGLYAVSFGNNTPTVYSGAQLKELFSIASDRAEGNYTEDSEDKEETSVEPIDLNKKEEDEN
jgi:hypothetical protein